jgi:hypothetical protein
MTAKNENMPYLVLISLVSVLAVGIFATGAFAGTEILAIGFVLIFTALLGWAAFVGFQNSMRHPGEGSRSLKEEHPAEKASCATKLSA